MNKKFFLIVMIMFVLSSTVFYYKMNKKETKVINDNIITADTYVFGDVDGNGSVGVSDYVLIRKHLLGTKLTGERLKRANVDGKEGISATDYIVIRKIILGIYKEIQSNVKVKVLDNGDSFEVYNIDVVSDYNADPRGVSDSTKAFKDAIKEAAKCAKASDNNKCGSIIYIPSGTYRLTDTIELPFYVELIGSKNGQTILNIEHSKEAIIAYATSSLKNIMFYYPNQNADNPIEYPATIHYKANMKNTEFYGREVSGTDGMSLENINFINSYIAMELNGAIFYLRDIYGTPLKTGLINDANLDTIKIDNLNFKADYWKNFNNSLVKPNSLSNLDNYLKNNATGIVIKRVDWYMLAKINVNGYNIGIMLDKNNSGDPTYGGKSEGELFDSKLTNCKYALQVNDAKHTVISNTTLSSIGGRALNIDSGIGWDFSIYGSTITSTGDYAIYHNGPGALTITNSKIVGKVSKTNRADKMSIVGSSLSNTGNDNRSIKVNLNLFNNNIGDYTKKVTTKPVDVKADNVKIIAIEANKNEDITNSIKNAISRLENGGIVYIPNGIYQISDTITVPSKVEIRGATSWAHHSRMINDYRGNGIGSTIIDTSNLSLSKNAFILNSNSGLNGFDIINIQHDKEKTAYLINGTGSNIYVINMNLPGAYNGINIDGDNHFVEHIWGGFYNEGIRLNGKNGMIRNCHITKNSLYYATLDAKLDKPRDTLYRKHKTVIVTGQNEILFNVFTFGPNVGFSFENAKDFKAIGIASDASGTGVVASLGSTGLVINSMIVSRSYDVVDGNNNVVLRGVDSRYIKTLPGFSGTIDFVNTMNWGNRNAISFELNGTNTSDLHFYGGLIDDSGSTAIKTSASAMIVSGVVFRTPSIKALTVNTGASGVQVIGNICEGYNSCKDSIVNNAGINIGVANLIQ